MISPDAIEEYAQAVKLGQKEVKELSAQGKQTNPKVLDDILEDRGYDTALDLGLVEIPADRIVGTRTAGRITAFSPSFRPLLSPDSEFALKWKSLCSDHLGNQGIRDPIECFEYLGEFYVQEGNKRVSVLRHFGAARIPGNVKRILPVKTEEPHIRAYYEFLEYYKRTKLYSPWFTRPGDYSKFLKLLGKNPDEIWTEEDRRSFNSRYHYFHTAFEAMKSNSPGTSLEEALMLWLQLYPYEDLSRLSAAQLQKTLEALSSDLVTAARQGAVQVETKAQETPKTNLLSWMTTPDVIHVAFVHQLTTAASVWAMVPAMAPEMNFASYIRP